MFVRTVTWAAKVSKYIQLPINAHWSIFIDGGGNSISNAVYCACLRPFTRQLENVIQTKFETVNFKLFFLIGTFCWKRLFSEAAMREIFVPEETWPSACFF